MLELRLLKYVKLKDKQVLETMTNKINLVNQLENQIATFLLDKLENIRPSPDQVKTIARFFLELVPEDSSNEEIRTILLKLDDNVMKVIKQGNFEKAMQMIVAKAV